MARLHIRLLGGFRVERAGRTLPDSVWQRRAAKRLTKLLATDPSHALHREQIIEILWPVADVESARNSFAKALHAARHAVEPDRLPRGGSAYFHVRDGMVALDTEAVRIDADAFERVAESALRLTTIPGYERALSVYAGELLPEDRYEDWCAARRDSLAEIHVVLLLGLAEALERRGLYSEAVDRLRAILQHDATREDVHRRLIRLYSWMGSRGLAIRQFEICRDVLSRQFDLRPDRQTEALYDDVVASRIEPRMASACPQTNAVGSHAATALPNWSTPLVGRAHLLQGLRQQLARAEAGNGGIVLVRGESGVGKTRLVSEFVAQAQRSEAIVIGGGHEGHGSRLPYGSFAVALDSYVAGHSDAERAELAVRCPALTQFVPSLEPATPLALRVDGCCDAPHVLTATVRFLTHLGETRPVVVVLGDLHDAHLSSIELLYDLAEVAPRRTWMIIGTLGSERIESGSEAARVLEAAKRERLFVHVELGPLAKEESDDFVRALLRGGVVGRSLLDRIYALSLGNPLFVEEVVREMRECGACAVVNGRWVLLPTETVRVPASVRALVEMRVASLETDVRRVLALVACAGREISLTNLGRGAASLQPALSRAELLTALDAALDARILEEASDGYTFRHPLVRAAFFDELPHHRRDELSRVLKRCVGNVEPAAIDATARAHPQARTPRRSRSKAVRAAS